MAQHRFECGQGYRVYFFLELEHKRAQCFFSRPHYWGDCNSSCLVRQDVLFLRVQTERWGRVLVGFGSLILIQYISSQQWVTESTTTDTSLSLDVSEESFARIPLSYQEAHTLLIDRSMADT